MQFYTTERPHQALGYQRPAEVYQTAVSSFRYVVIGGTPLIFDACAVLTAGSTINEALRASISARLGAVATVHPAPQAYTVDLEHIKLIVEIAAGSAAFIKTLLEIKQIYAERGIPTHVTVAKPGKGEVALDQANESLVHDLIMEPLSN